MKHPLKRSLAIASVLAVGTFTGLSATAASAATPELGNIDVDRIGSLTVHKYLHQSGTTEGDISEAPAAGDFTDPVKDVFFTAYPLIKDGETAPLDLSVPGNWYGLDTLVAGEACTAPAGYSLGTAIPLPGTDDTGMATVDLGLGLYQVCEVDAPAHIVDTALPFIVTVPTPYNDGWIYDVHAYPKNGAAAIEKTIDPQTSFGLGSAVTFPVTSTIPTMAKTWSGYAISDNLDPRLEANAATSGIASVTVDGAPLDSTYYEKILNGQTVVMKFTAAGIAWLNEDPSHAGSVIEVVFDAVVVEVGDGVIENTAILWPNDPNMENEDKTIPSPVVHTSWGSLAVLKRAVNTTGTEGTLAGATFEVYAAADPYAASCTAAVASGDPIEVDGVTEFTSDATGVVTVTGLFVSDSVNPTIDAAQRCYVLKEIAAPAGYVLPQGTAAFTGVAVHAGATTTTENVEITNTQASVPSLPLTGGNGTIALIALAIGGAFLAVGLAIVKRRRSQTTAV